MFEIKLLLKNKDSLPHWWENISQVLVIHSEEELAKNEDHLIFDGSVLAFRSKHTDHSQFTPIFFDFDQVIGQYQDEFLRKSKKNELLYKAFNFKTIAHPIILDASCGTAKDALTLWFFGAKIVAYERNPVVYLLLRDALARSTQVTMNFELFFGIGSDCRQTVDMIYFDPMFPEKKKSALPSKEMQVFKYLVGADDDQVLEATKLKAKNPKRLVIKRPQVAPPIIPNPSMNYESKLLRLDCYL